MTKMITVKCTPDMLVKKNTSMDVFFNEFKNTIRKSGIIVYPTDTFYALGVSVCDPDAVSRIYKLKKRPRTAPISIAVHDVNQIEKYAYPTQLSKHLAEKYLPGPLTLVLRNRDNLAGLQNRTIGLRVPANVVALKLIEHCGPLTATSANVHGGIEPTIIESARIQLKDNVDIYIDGGRYRGTKGSTVIDLSGKKPKILRDGLIPAKCLEVDLDAA